MALLTRIFFCIGVFGLFLYRYIDQQNSLTQVRMEIPVVEKELRRLSEENVALRYEIEKFESPQNLLRLSQKPEFSHLRHPTAGEIIIISN